MISYYMISTTLSHSSRNRQRSMSLDEPLPVYFFSLLIQEMKNNFLPFTSKSSPSWIVMGAGPVRTWVYLAYASTPCKCKRKFSYFAHCQFPLFQDQRSVSWTDSVGCLQFHAGNVSETASELEQKSANHWWCWAWSLDGELVGRDLQS